MPGKKDAGRRSAPPELAGIFSAFSPATGLAAVEPYGLGHIHQTYRVRMRERPNRDYILQRINTRIFTDIPRLMENIVRVTGHVRRKVAASPGGDPDREVLTVVPALDGRPFHLDETGSYWRCFVFIEHQELGERPRDPRKAFEAGLLFGRFVSQLSDLPPASLHEVIPRFHDVEFRLGEFAKALQDDPLKRRQGAGEEVAFVLARAEEMKRVLVAGREGRIQLRVTHNDTKFNNVLFDRAGRGLCLIDLDTVMPGYVQYDFGDAVRSVANKASEDEESLERVGIDLGVFRELARGFLHSLHGSLGAEEIGLLACAAKLFPYMIGLRFLSDHLAGDLYFKTARPGHNLRRARAQFALLADMELHFAEMEETIFELAGKKDA